MDAAIPKDAFQGIDILGRVKQAKQMYTVFADCFKTGKYDDARRLLEESARRLALLGGSMPDFEVPPRRRPDMDTDHDGSDKAIK